MSASFTLRRYVEADLDAVLRVFRDSVGTLAAEHYDADQRAAWQSAADDGAAFGARFDGLSMLVAERDGEIVGFAGRAGNLIDFLFVAPQAARTGIASALYAALEAEALDAGEDMLTTEASHAARSFFEGQGFTFVRENRRERNGVVLTNNTMTKPLAQKVPA
ncbi:GNAT family N-acetyltransferase [Tepidamorphus sp. 3E244]|uniref:GNAT family N-acetyltransferase n=1 Tax=Tepidamorphus sp. 3E244 TaxID=3385498 RepID=UPI0038FC98B6